MSFTFDSANRRAECGIVNNGNSQSAREALSNIYGNPMNQYIFLTSSYTATTLYTPAHRVVISFVLLIETNIMVNKCY